MASWSRIIRFLDFSNNEHLGEPCVDNSDEIENLLQSNNLWAVELTGSSLLGPLTRGAKVRVKSLGHILQPSDVPIIRCIGLNYLTHSRLAVEDGQKCTV